MLAMAFVESFFKKKCFDYSIPHLPFDQQSSDIARIFVWGGSLKGPSKLLLYYIK